MPVAVAWGPPTPYSLVSGPPDRVLWGCEGEVLPGGTMFAAQCMLHCIVGRLGTINESGDVKVDPDSNLLLYGIRGTETEEVAVYEADLLESLSAMREPIS